MAFIEININGKPIFKRLNSWFYGLFHNKCPNCYGSGETHVGRRGYCGSSVTFTCIKCGGTGKFFIS